MVVTATDTVLNVGTDATVDELTIDQVADSADFDEDFDIDGFDFLAWQLGFGTPAPNATKSDGDADNDLKVDSDDLTMWENQFGTESASLVATATVSSEKATVGFLESQTTALTADRLSPELVDAAMAMDFSLRTKIGSHLGSPWSHRKDHFDRLSHSTRH